MNLTAYDIGQRSPADFFPAESRLKIIRRQEATPAVGLSPLERERRQKLYLEARERFETMAEMARLIGTHSGSLSKWANGQRPVPDRFMSALERIAGGGE